MVRGKDGHGGRWACGEDVHEGGMGMGSEQNSSAGWADGTRGFNTVGQDGWANGSRGFSTAVQNMLMGQGI